MSNSCFRFLEAAYLSTFLSLFILMIMSWLGFISRVKFCAIWEGYWVCIKAIICLIPELICELTMAGESIILPEVLTIVTTGCSSFFTHASKLSLSWLGSASFLGSAVSVINSLGISPSTDSILANSKSLYFFNYWNIISSTLTLMNRTGTLFFKKGSI